MKNIIVFIVCIYFITLPVLADTEKNIQKNIPIEQGKKIEFDGFTGLKVDFIKWDKNEIGFRLKVVIDCSDSDYEKEYADSLDIVSKSIDSKQVITLVRKQLEAKKSSFFGLFSFRFMYHFRSKIVGEIYIPSTFPGSLNISYSDLYFSGMNQLPEIIGRSNDLVINNCSMIPKIDNPYGNIKLDNTSSSLTIFTRSNKVEISGHKGNLEISGEYSDVKLSDVDGIVIISDRSCNIDISNSTLKKIYAPYSEIVLRNILKSQNDELQISGNSLTCSFDYISPDIQISSDYSKVSFNNLKGALSLTGHSTVLKGKKLYGNLYIDTHYGKIEIDDLNGKETKISNTNDHIYLYYSTEPGLIDIKNTYGDVKLKVPRTYKGEITATASYGKIESDFNTKVTSQKYNQVTAFQPREAEAGRITIATQNGDIYLVNKKSNYFFNPIIIE